MMQPLTDAQEALARDLADVLRDGTDDLLLQIARQLVATTDATLFGDTEVRLRDLALKLAARAYDLHLREKKTATTAPPPPAPPALTPPVSTPIARARP